MLDLLDRLRVAITAGERVALTTVIGVDGSAPRASGARMLVWADGATYGTVGGGNFEWQVTAQAVEALAEGRPRRFTVHLTRDLGMCCGGAMDVYIEPVEAEARLVIYGAGHVGRATAEIALAAGFHVTVVDEREEQLERCPGVRVHADPRRFPVETDRRTYLLVTTHEHRLDQDLLEALIAREYAWLGVIGSRAKLAKFFLRLKAAGVDEALFSRVSGPVGLDIGAETPGEIAVSIVAELVRVRRHADRPPISLAEIPLPARGGDGTAKPPGLGVRR